MRLELSRLVLVKRYLWGSLIVAIVPLVLLAALYDRYSSDLLDNLLTERVDGELHTTSVRMISFINAQIKRLDNLVDLPEITQVFSKEPTTRLPTQLIDFLYLEIGNPDIYGVEFFNAKGGCLRSLPPQSKKQQVPDYAKLPVIVYNGAEILGPVVPSDGRPGWFLLRKKIIRNERVIGSLALKVRLSSFTELAASLFHSGIYEPRISIYDNIHLSVVGTQVLNDIPVSKELNVLDGWNVSLVRSGKNIEGSRDNIRYALLVVAIFACLAVVWIFIHMSEKLARVILPLNEGAKAISRGDFSVRVNENGPGELRNLAQSFNQMSTQLSTLINSRIDMERQAALGNFAAGIAHEVRNPLTTMRTTVHGLMRHEEKPEHQKMFQVVIDEILRVDAIVEEFLGYARPREPRKEAIQAKEIFKSIEALISGTLQEKQIRMALAGDSSLVLHVDPAQLRQILMNVVLNAIQSMDAGGYLTIRSQLERGYAEIMVKDTGEGIGPEKLDKVFTPFYTTRAKGTGLGLSICRQLTMANGGDLQIESTLGEGTTVFIKIPVYGSLEEG